MKKNFRRHDKTAGMPKPVPWQSFLTLLALVCLFTACVSQAPEQAFSQGSEKSSGYGLDTPRFRDLPPEAKEYLEILAKAFREKDKAFLISQGEAQYEKDLRFTLDEEIYLALLYRIGPYSEDLPWESSAPPRLDVSKVRGIEYTGWEEKGPMLEIKGRLYVQKNDSLPCGIVLVWRLPEPKILGERP